MNEIKRRILNVFIAVDQLGWTVLTLGGGEPDETISAALWRMEQQGKRAGKWFRPVVDALFRPLEAEHCRQAWQAEIDGSQLPATYQAARIDRTDPPPRTSFHL